MAATSATQTAEAERRAFRSRRGATSGCTSRVWAPTAPSTRSRSSSAARAATSGTSTATATSTASRRSSASTPATAAAELGEAAARQVEELDFITVWSYAHPRAIELATRIASLAPGDLNRVFFTNGGSEAVESALKLARSYHRTHGQRPEDKLIAREIAYHGTTLGALSARPASPRCARQFEPLAPGGVHVPNTNSYRWPEDRDPLWAADRSRSGSCSRGPRRSPR